MFQTVASAGDIKAANGSLGACLQSSNIIFVGVSRPYSPYILIINIIYFNMSKILSLTMKAPA